MITMRHDQISSDVVWTTYQPRPADVSEVKGLNETSLPAAQVGDAALVTGQSDHI
jgi:hypothetical protein